MIIKSFLLVYLRTLKKALIYPGQDALRDLQGLLYLGSLANSALEIIPDLSVPSTVISEAKKWRAQDKGMSRFHSKFPNKLFHDLGAHWDQDK
jgi:hypothetical protein